jgi:hypothetical protein
MAYFQMQKSDRQLTIFTTHSTTISPQKHHNLHHNLHHTSSKPPAKQPLHHKRKKQKKQKNGPAKSQAAVFKSAISVSIRGRSLLTP